MYNEGAMLFSTRG